MFIASSSWLSLTFCSGDSEGCLIPVHACCMLSHLVCVRLPETLWTVARQTPSPQESPGKNTGVGRHDLLQLLSVWYMPNVVGAQEGGKTIDHRGIWKDLTEERFSSVSEQEHTSARREEES